MSIHELASQRKTTYVFSNKPVKEEAIIKILDTARLAPAAGGVHEYEFIVVTDPAKKLALSKASMTPNIDSARFIIVLVCDPQKLRNVFGEDGDVFCIENAAMAIDNILMMAEESGLGAAWIATFNEADIRAALDIPEGYLIRGVIPVGYAVPGGSGAYPGMPPKLNEMIHLETFKSSLR